MRKLITKRGLVVSCQAYESEPLFGPHHMVQMAKAAQLGGAIGIRANGFTDIAAIKQAIQVPVIGLNKRKIEGSEVYITPTLEDALSVHSAGADIVAIDATQRQRPDGKTLKEIINELQKKNISRTLTWSRGWFTKFKLRLLLKAGSAPHPMSFEHCSSEPSSR